MAWWGSQTRHDATVKVIEMYEAANPDIKIEYEFYDSEGYLTKLNTLVASDEVWDIFQLGGNFPTYQEKIVTMDEFIEQGIIDVSDTTEEYLKTTNYNGEQIGVSSGVNTYGIAYDPAMFEEAGIEEPSENWTWDDWKEICLELHEKLGIYGSSKMGDKDFEPGATARVSQYGYDLNFFATTNDQLGFDDPSMLEGYFEIRKELVDAGAYPDPGALAEISNIENDFLVTGEAAMTWVASNQLIALEEAAGRDLKVVPIPRVTSDGPAGITVTSSQMLCVSQDSEVPEEAAKFINFFLNDEEANKVLLGERGVPIMSKVREAVLTEADENTEEVFDFVELVGSFETGELNPISPESTPEIRDQYALLLDQVIYGEKTPKEAAQEIFDFAASKLK
ncbi:MAG: ABC transporter substrate-binding protein [Lachnospiraceae bacterium]